MVVPPRLRHWIIPLLLALACTLAASHGPGERLDLGLADLTSRFLRQWLPRAASEVVVVGVDEASISSSGKPFALMMDEFSALFDGLRMGAPRAVGVDLVLPVQGYEHLAPGSARRLAQSIAALRDTLPLVLGTQASALADARGASWYAPVAGLDNLALLYVTLDRDGVLRRIDPAQAPALAVRVAERLGAAPRYGMVDYAVGAPFRYVPLHQVVALARTQALPELRRLFAGKVVMVGVVLPDQDRQHLPLPLAAWETSSHLPGVLYQSQAVRNLLDARVIRPLAWAPVLLALAAACALWRARADVRTAAWRGGLLLTGLALASLVLQYHGWELRIGAPVLSTLATAVVLQVADRRRQLAEQQRLRGIFAGYVSPAILDTILSGALKEQPRGRREKLAFLFADIRGFTAFCASHEPEEVIVFLNRYYAAAAPAMHAHGGTIDKFSGDGMMAFFGAPRPDPNPCRSAVLAALDLLLAVERLNADAAATTAPPLRVGIGIAFGDAVLGNVGCPERHDYAATGAATALAAHLQQHCKRTRYPMLVDATALELAALPPALANRFTVIEIDLDKHGTVKVAGYLGATTDVQAFVDAGLPAGGS